MGSEVVHEAIVGSKDWQMGKAVFDEAAEGLVWKKVTSFHHSHWEPTYW